MSELKVGDVLWFESFWREWRFRAITGETKLSWIVGEGWSEEKANKKTLLTAADRQGRKTRYYTAQQRDDKMWVDANRHRIESKVCGCSDRATLEKIEELLT